MSRQFDFFFFIGSTYTYLTVMRLEALAERERLAVRWRPFNVRAIMLKQSNIPFRSKPVKMAYMWRDVERRARRYGIPFRSIPPYPVDPDDLANRVAVLAATEGWCPEYTRATYLSWFVDGKAPGEIEHLRSLLSDLGRDPEAVIARANEPDIRERYGAETAAAEAMGIFGSPTFVARDEIFWGDDRLDDAIEWLRARA
jgi:2-hydroxychromene-2-carboxylate isomerase